MLRPILTLALLAACDGEPVKRHPAPEPLVDECDPVVRAATSPLLGEPADADPHADTFGALEPDPYHVHLGWPSSDPSRSISFLWRTDVDTLATVVEYGADGALDQRVEGASFLYGGIDSGEGPQRMHEIKLCGSLEPGTTYTYRVGGDGHWSPEYTFTTPEPPGSFDTFTIGVIGDSRGAYEAWDDLLLGMEAHEPDFYVFGGDMVDIGPSQPQWDAWFEAAGDLFARKVIVPAHGNHEFLSVHYFAQFSMPNNEQWFSIRYGDMHLVSLNDTVYAAEERSRDQVEYMNQVFGEVDSAWQVAVHHQSLYSTCTTHGSDLDLRMWWGPVYDAHEVDLVFAGHNHVYERSVPIRSGVQVSPETGTHYFVTGGAGAPLYTGFLPDWYSLVAESVEHYLIADFSPSGVTVVARDRAGNAIDTLSLPRRDSR